MNRTCTQCQHFHVPVGRCTYFTFITSEQSSPVAHRCLLYQNDPQKRNLVRFKHAPVAPITVMEEKPLYEQYPLEPIVPSSEEGIWWYASPDRTYGFWTNAKIIGASPAKPDFQNGLKPYTMWYVDSRGNGQFAIYNPKMKRVLLFCDYLPSEVV